LTLLGYPLTDLLKIIFLYKTSIGVDFFSKMVILKIYEFHFLFFLIIFLLFSFYVFGTIRSGKQTSFLKRNLGSAGVPPFRFVEDQLFI
jgi:hypothetical protein